MAIRTSLARWAALGALLALGACTQVPLNPSASASPAASAPTEEDHAAHHPAGESAVPTAPPAAVAPAAPMTGTAGMAEHMKAMQAMHEKMSRARTPEERSAVMAEHQGLMQECMSMMHTMMGPGGMKGMDGMKGMGGMGHMPPPAGR